MKEKNKKKHNNNIKILGIILFISIIAFSSVFAYYTNTHKYFDESRTDDVHYGGFALKREANDFIVDGCGSGTMLDTVTGLCWLKNMNTFGQRNWTTALIDCSNLDYAEHTDWRLPEKNELFTLIDQIGTVGSTCSTLGSFGFTSCQDDYYWSSNEYEPINSSAWDVSFGNGNDGNNGKAGTLYVVCVR